MKFVHRRHHCPDRNDHGVSAVDLQLNIAWRHSDHCFRLPVRDGVIAADRRDRLVIKSDFRNDGSNSAVTCLIFLIVGWTGPTITSQRFRLAALFASPPRTAARRRRI